MYAGDSFFTLSPAGQLGLACLSAASAAVLVGGLLRVRLGRLAKLGLAVVLFWAFVWLSPQLYYTYYRAIIPGLPAQIVLKKPPGPGHLAALATFSARQDLSDHGKGALWWALICAVFVGPRKKHLGKGSGLGA